MSLVQLPPELLYHILAFFDAYDLIRIRQVSEQSADYHKMLTSPRHAKR